MFEYLNSLIDTLSLDHRRGAAEIVTDIADLLDNIGKIGLKDPDVADQLFKRTIRRLVKGQPSMAPVLNLLNKVCAVKQLAGDDWGKIIIGLDAVSTERNEQMTVMEGLVKELPEVSGTLMIYSNSSTVVRMLKQTLKGGWPKRVICSEARPVNEGLVMGRKLTQLGIEVTVYTDAALMSKIVEADAVWIGGDAISRDGLVNKVGSRALAILAGTQNIPFISLTSTYKVLSDEMLSYFKFLPQNPREIAADDAEDLNVINEYYETIPLDMVTYFFTENGLQRPKKLLESVTTEKVNSLFSELVKS